MSIQASILPVYLRILVTTLVARLVGIGLVYGCVYYYINGVMVCTIRKQTNKNLPTRQNF